MRNSSLIISPTRPVVPERFSFLDGTDDAHSAFAIREQPYFCK